MFCSWNITKTTKRNKSPHLPCTTNYSIGSSHTKNKIFYLVFIYALNITRKMDCECSDQSSDTYTIFWNCLREGLLETWKWYFWNKYAVEDIHLKVFCLALSLLIPSSPPFFSLLPIYPSPFFPLLPFLSYSSLLLSSPPLLSYLLLYSTPFLSPPLPFMPSSLPSFFT